MKFVLKNADWNNTKTAAPKLVYKEVVIYLMTVLNRLYCWLNYLELSSKGTAAVGPQPRHSKNGFQKPFAMMFWNSPHDKNPLV